RAPRSQLTDGPRTCAMAWQWQRRRTWSHALLKEVGITVRSGIFLIDQVERATQMVDRLRVFLSLCKRLRHAPMTGDGIASQRPMGLLCQDVVISSISTRHVTELNQRTGAQVDQPQVGQELIGWETLEGIFYE